jgi:peptidoglycan/LPS O-acetylase OafA/YrhL
LFEPGLCGSVRQMKRLDFLDGLRGWGAVVVLLYHVFSGGLPVNGTTGTVLSHFVPFNGPFAVMVFFLVSGFSLSVRYLFDGDIQAWSRILAGRYFRLVIPIFVACLVVHLAMVGGLIRVPVDGPPPFDRFFRFDPTIAHLLRFTLFDVFFDYRLEDTYIGPLWTMSIELFGSVVTLLAVVVARPLPYRPLLMVGLSIVLLLVPMRMLALFPLGVALADCFNRGWLDIIPWAVSVTLMVAGCVISGALPFGVASWGIAAVALVVGCIAMPGIRAFLSGSLSIELGRISFPLYLIHGAVRNIVGEPLMRGVGGSIAGQLAVDLIVIVGSIGAAYALLPVNIFAISVSQRFGRWISVTMLRLRRSLMPDDRGMGPSGGSSHGSALFSSELRAMKADRGSRDHRPRA